MKTIKLEKGESFYIGEKCYFILKGRGIMKYILSDGKTIVNEYLLEENKIIYNLLTLDSINKTSLFKNPEGLFKVFEETLIEEIEINSYIKKNLYTQIIESYILKEMNLIMTSIEYVFFTLKRYSKNNCISKTVISYDDFNLSRSQFYLVLKKLKESKLIVEDDRKYILVEES